MSGRFVDTTAIVTGGGAHSDRALGIGEETAKLLSREGADVVVLDVEAAIRFESIRTSPVPVRATIDLDSDAGPSYPIWSQDFRLPRAGPAHRGTVPV